MAGKTSPKLVGLDIGASGIRAVELKRDRKSGEYTIAKAAWVDLPRGAVRNGVIAEPEAVTKGLRQLWRKGRFSTRKVALGLADSGVLTRQMDLPWMPADDFRSALRYQISEALPVDLSTVEIDYHLLGESQRKDDHGGDVELNRILIVAANSDAVTSEAQAVRKARLEPVAADSAAFALIRSVCRGVLPPDDQVHAVADVGADQLTVVIHQGGQPRFIRTIANLGGDTATVAVAERVRIDPDEAETLKRVTGLNGPAPVVAPIAESSVFGGLAPDSAPVQDPRTSATVDALNPWATTVIGEIRNSLDYFQASDPSAPIRTLTIAGRTVQLDGLLERIATQIPLTVKVMDPLAGLSASKSVMKHHESDTRLVVAIGLAMGGEK
jgi:type IV pilus assembly protein PilM